MEETEPMINIGRNLFDELPKDLHKKNRTLFFEATGLYKQQQEILWNAEKKEKSFCIKFLTFTVKLLIR